ncbi:MAG: hypothetical protein AABW73_02120 [Nanoarchaeota archaeon]
MSLEKRFGSELKINEGDLAILEMNDGSIILGRYRSEDKSRRQDNMYVDSIVIKDGERNRYNRLQDCKRLRVREVESITMLSESTTYTPRVRG